MAVLPAKWLFTVDEYHRMSDFRIFTEDDRVELIEGEIVQMTPIGSRHAACVRRLIHLFSQNIGNQALVDAQNPTFLSKISEPQPDILLMKPKEDFYESGHPKPEDVLLLVEVSDSSIHFDRNVKLPLYAKSGIVEAWIVDIDGASIESYHGPSAQGYQTKQTFHSGEKLSPQAFPDLIVPVDKILGYPTG